MIRDSPDSPTPEPDYCYPPVQIHHSLEPLDLNALIMRSDARRQPDEGPSSLADSSFEVLSRSMCEMSDDEGHTESLASTDHSPDDLSSLCDEDEFDDHEEDNEVDFVDEPPSHHHQFYPEPPEPAAEQYASQYTTGGDESMMTSRAADTLHGDTGDCRLEEDFTMGKDLVRASGIIREFTGESDNDIPKVLQSFGCSELRLSVKMVLSRHFLPESRSFRLLYVGDIDGWAVTHVNKRIGAALNATPSSSRFNIVQGSDIPGSPSSSKVQLERSGSELVVDHCINPKIVDETDGTHRVVITLDDGSHIAFGPNQDIQPADAPIPDLIIFGHATMQSESDLANSLENFRVARDTLKQHNIPSLDVSVVRPFNSEEYGFEADSLQLCVEGRKDSDEAFVTQKTIPIDLYSFLAIDPSQLNRHLAFLRDRFNANHKVRSKRTPSWNIKSVLHESKTRLEPQIEWWTQRRGLPIFALITLTIAYLIQGALLPSGPGGILDRGAETSVSLCNTGAPQTSLAAPTSVYTSSTPIPSSAQPSKPPLQAVSAPRDLTVVPPPEKSDSRGSRKYTKEKVENFVIEATGEHQFTLRPSKQLISIIKKQPPQIQVYRGSELVPVRVFRNVDNSYQVDLENQYPIETFTVSVVLRRKPLLQQAFNIKLGSSKSSFSSFMMNNMEKLSKVVRHDLAVAQQNVKSLSTQFSKSLQEGVSRMEENTKAAVSEQSKFWKRQVHDSKQTVSEHIKEFQEQTTQQLSTVGSWMTKDVSKALQDTWEACSSRASSATESITSNVWQKTRPCRTSPRVLRARKNALKLRCKLEKSLGSVTSKSCGEHEKEAKKQHKQMPRCKKSKSKTKA